MKIKIKCPKGNRHIVCVHHSMIYCEKCDEYLKNDLLDELVSNCVEEGKKRGKEEVKTALGI